MRRELVIDNKLRKSRNIVYGARAMNKQLPLGLQRPTFDYDIYSKTPRKSARRLERCLDRDAGGDYYYTKPAQHKGTVKVMDIGEDNRRNTMDDYGVADYTRPERKIKSVRINNIRYAHLSEREKDARKSLRDPAFKFRHDKDRYDLYRIKKGRKILRW